jgi:hypothetical protein
MAVSNIAVHRQRRGKRKRDHGEPGGGMTAERAAKLTALGVFS